MKGDIVNSGQIKEKDRSLLPITIAVILVHFSLFLLSALFPNPKPIVQPPVKQLIVKTINFQAEKRQNSTPKPQKVSIPDPEETEIAFEEVLTPVADIPEEMEEPTEPPKPKDIPKKVEKKEIRETPPAKKLEKMPVEKAKPKKPKENAQTPKKEAKKPEKTKSKAEEKKVTPKASEKPKSKIEKPKVNPEVEGQKAKKAKQDAEIMQKKRSLLENAQKSIAQIEQSRDKVGATSSKSTFTSTLPGKIADLQVETFLEDVEGKLSAQEVSYYDELASRLKLLLRLPEYGEVKIKLTLDRSGKFLKVNVVNAQSSNNKKYVEGKLPTLTYPAFGDYFDAASQYTFFIALSNE